MAGVPTSGGNGSCPGQGIDRRRSPQRERSTRGLTADRSPLANRIEARPDSRPDKRPGGRSRANPFAGPPAAGTARSGAHEQAAGPAKARSGPPSPGRTPRPTETPGLVRRQADRPGGRGRKP